MSKDKLQLLSPLFLKYQADFEKNPRSRVFAPLAETYRKLGMSDKAMAILSQGIRFNPTYQMGYLGLAFCYYDLKQFNLAYSTLRPLIESNRDNIRLQKLFADSCLELDKKEEALETLKYLLFVSPKDKEIAELVLKVEKEVDDRYKPNHKPIIIPENEFTAEAHDKDKSEFFDLNKLKSTDVVTANDFDDWMTIDFSHAGNSNATNESINENVKNDYDQWSLKKNNEESYKLPEAEVETSFHVHLDLDQESEEDSAPLVTHTLVDLYCGQGHIEKALQVLEKILLLNPNDKKTIQKIKEIEALAQPFDEPVAEEKIIQENHFVAENISEEEGRRHLMSLIDEQLGTLEIGQVEPNLDLTRQIEEKLSLFLKKIQKRALDYQARV